jgi:mono/diheme cytochrome c family protein
MYRRVSCVAIVTLGLAACGDGRSDAPHTPATAEEIGARIYSGSCAACHQPDARGIPGVYPSLVGSPLLLGAAEPLTLWVIQGRRPPSLPEGRYQAHMPQFGWLGARDATALFNYLRSNFGNAAPPVDEPSVARALAANRTGST